MKVYRILLVVSVFLAGWLSPVVSQNHFMVIGGIPHFPVMEPASISAPEHGMIIFSDAEQKPLIYTNNGWETLCTLNLTDASLDEFFTVKNGIPFLPSLSLIPASPKAGSIYYSVVNKAMMIYNGTAWFKMPQMKSGAFTSDGGFASGPDISTYKLPIANTPPNILSISKGAFYINALSRSIKYFDGTIWKDISCQAIVTTAPVTSQTGYEATSGGEVLTNGSSDVSQVGICWSPFPEPDTLLVTKTRLTTVGDGVGSFVSQMTDLLPKTKYYVRAYAVNQEGIVYGQDVIFTTPVALPTIITLPTDSISSTRVISGGNILADGGSPITHRGIIWSKQEDPLNDQSHNITDDGSGVGKFPSTLMNLLGSTTYYIRAYAVNSAGKAYGNLIVFTTKPPVVPRMSSFVLISGITGNSASTSSMIIDNGGDPVIERGVCISTDRITYQYIPSSTVTPTDIGNFKNDLSGLVSGTVYYVKAYAKNAIGIGYSSETSFSTSSSINMTTVPPSDISNKAATSGGIIIDAGVTNITAKGICWDTIPNPVITLNTKTSVPIVNDGTDNFSSNMTGLKAGIKYYVRAYAVNTNGISYGNLDSLVTLTVPSVSTVNISSIVNNTATSGGIVVADGGTPVTSRGLCWSQNHNPTIYSSNTPCGSGLGLFGGKVTGLTANITYYVRAYATNAIGTAYGEEKSVMIIPGVTGVLVVTTSDISDITYSSAKGGGNVTDDGGAEVTKRGVLWSYAGDPLQDVNAGSADSGTGNGEFSSLLKQLLGSKTYYVRAYATNDYGTAYGDIVEFTTQPPVLPKLTKPTFNKADLTNNTAIGSFEITENGGAPITTRGIAYSTDNANFLYANTTNTNLSDIGNFLTSLTGLTKATVYYAKAFAINSVGIAFSDAVTFRTNSIPELTTAAHGNITITSATSGGDVSFNGNDLIKAKGVCWSTFPDPIYNLPTRTSEALDGTDLGSFVSSLSGLTPGTKYYIRAYAVNSYGVGYGNQDSIITMPHAAPLLTTLAPSVITGTSANSGGNISYAGESPVTVCGVCWSTSPSPTIALPTKTSGPASGIGSFTSVLTTLIPNTKYYVRAYARNSLGISYGNSDSLLTATLPSGITTARPSEITKSSAICGGEITNDGRTPITIRGVCWGTSPNPTVYNNSATGGSGTGVFTCNATNLLASTKYYIRAYATNDVGTVYGNLDSLVTGPPSIPIVSTTMVNNIAGVSAMGNGNVLENGGAPVAERGICWNNTGNPSISDNYVQSGSGNGAFSGNITGLTPISTYYVRAYAVNSIGIAYGNEVSFATFTNASVVTSPVTTFTNVSAIGGGQITSDGGTPVTTSGICWNITGNPTISDTHTTGNTGIGDFIHNMEDLKASTKYYVRAYAINNAGITYGNVQTFTTGDPTVPLLVTSTATVNPSAKSALCGGTISSNGGDEIKTVGVVWCTVSGFKPDTVVTNRVTQIGNGSFSVTLPNLALGVTYYVKAFATNKAGTAYALNEVSFTNYNFPEVTTLPVSNIATTTADASGNISSNGGTDVSVSGICWSTGTNPTTADNKTENNTGIGTFISSVTDLLGSTQYYVRAYATNSIGTAYGAVVSFTTKPPVLPTVLTQAVSVNSATAAVSGGNITDNGGALVITRGIFWCTQANFNTDTILVNKTAETGYFKGSFTSKMTGLQPNTVYYVKAYAVNSLGMAFGEEVSFKTPYKPSVFTKAGISNGPTKATTGGDITDNGNADISDRGVVYSTMPGFIPDTVLVRITHDGGGDGSFSSKLSELKGNTTYYVTAFATNMAGTSYGNMISFITDPPTLPTVTTVDASDINGTYVTGGGNISEDGGETVTTRGLVWSTVSGFRADTVVVNKTAAVGYGKGSFSAFINRLRQGVTYYFRAYAVNSVGTAYGKELSFTTFNLPTLTTMNTLPASDAKSASSGGTIIDDGGTPIIDQGVCWSLFSNPTVSLPTKTSGDAGDGKNFYSNIVGLNPITKYYVKAYAVNNQGTAYGNELTFTTPPAKPTITTNIVVPISQSSIVTGGKILTDGGAAVTSRGLVWSTNPNFNPDTVSVNKVVNASNSNNFTSTIIGLKTSIAYYIRAYAVNSAGTGYGNQVAFTLFPTAPLLNTVDVLQVGGASANSGAVITSDGGAEITQKGICWATHTNPTIDDVYTINGSGTDNFSAVLTGLKPNTLYYVRAYAINKIGVAYGVEKTILTNALPTLLATVPATNIIATTATSGGEITDDGRSPILAKGICWDTRMNPTIALSTKTVDNSPGIGTFAADMSGLSPETTYYVRAYATNAVGTSYGTQITFRTKAVFLPVLTTIKPFNIDSVKAISGGIITNDGGMPVTERGICWSAFPRPSTSLATRVSDLAGGNGTFNLGFKGLIPGAKYYVRAYAVNSKGIAYGNQDSLITQAVKPAVSNVVVSGLTKTTAVATASVITDGGAYVTVRGFCWTTSGVPSIANDTLHVGAGIGSFATTIKNLIQGTAYNIRAFAINSAGIVYGPVYMFTTLTVPTLTTLDISGLNVTKTASDIIVNVASGGNITSDGGAAVTARGVCWSTSPTPTEQATTKTTNGSGTGAFASAVNGLAMETTYYIRAYATNSAGTGYGNEIVYMPPKLPVVTTAPATISPTSASTANGGGEVTSDGGNHVTARGVCWSTAPGSSSVSGLHSTDGADVGVFNSTLIGLASSSTYYVRAYATNAIGTVYGNEVSFNTPSLPTVTTVPMISSVDTAGLATGGGSIINDGGAAVTVRGVCWSASSNPVATGLHTSNGEGIGDFISKITGLNAGTKYYVRAYATNSVGTAYGNEVTVSTPVVPTVTTYPASISYIDPSMATGGGEVTATGGAPVTARGVYWSTSNAVPALNAPHSIDGDGMGTFSSSITALVSGTTYYVRAYATNIIGTGFGSPVSITAPTAPIVTTIQPVSSTTNNSQALGGGIITSDGGAPVTSRGVCWSNVTSAPTTSNSKSVDGTGAGLFNSTITGLANETRYYVRAYAINAIGISYGPYAIIVTKTIPTVTTAIPTISSDEPGIVTSGGNVADDGGAAITARGVCWSLTKAIPTLADGYTVDGAGTGIFSSTLAGLDATKSYYVRAYATNAAGTAYGPVQVPTTPTVSTSLAFSSTDNNKVAFAGGIVSDEGGAAVLARGVCWLANNSNPTIANSKTVDGTRAGSFNSTMTGLANGTTYYVKAYVTNAMGTTYGPYVRIDTKSAPTVTTAIPTISSDEPGIVTSGGNVSDDGGAAITARGVCWSLTKTTPTLADDYTRDDAGMGSFKSTLVGLDATKSYYVRAYATNAAGTTYGPVQVPTNPTVATSGVNITTAGNTTALSGGRITDEGGAAVLARGVCWLANNSNPTIANAKTVDGTRAGSFTSTMTGLVNGTRYYVKAYVTNAMGTTYGPYATFIAGTVSNTITVTAPKVTTYNVSISTDRPAIASSGGNVYDDGGALITERGVCWSTTNATPTLADAHTSDGTGAGNFNSILTGLDASKKYYVRAYATNSAGLAYGNVVTPGLPSVITTAVTLSDANNSLASGGGMVTDEGGAEVTARGICWLPNNGAPTIANPKTVDGDRSGNFSSAITGLVNGTTYYIRAYATNAYGTSYGPYVPVTTKEIPTVTTNVPSISADRPSVASSGGNVTNDGGAAITARGVCWSTTNATPTLADAHTSDGTGAGNFNSTLSGLDASKKYYVRAYATNSAGLAYGNVVTPGLPSVITTAVTLSDTNNSLASGGGMVTDEGGAEVTARGICWLPNNGAPTIANPKTVDGDRSGNFSSAITGLVNGTTYYIRAYATNVYGTSYGPYVPVTTKVIPTVTTNVPSISTDKPSVASSGGNVTNDGGADITARGVCWSTTNATPTLADAHTSDGTGAGNFNSTLSGLDASKKYYVRAYATNSAGLAYGNVVTPGLPSVITTAVTLSDTNNSLASGGGMVTDEGGAEVTARGICWLPNNGAPTTANPKTMDGDRSGNFSSAITGLVNGTTYYIRAYATNAYGTSYGPYVPVTTKVIPTVTTNVPSISTDKPSVASSGGNVTNDGGAAITARGVCWSTTNATPTLADAHTSDGTGAGNFNSTLTGLDASKKYYVRSYATNSAGLAYGNVVTPGLPSVITTAVTLSDTNNSLASGGGVVTDEGGAEVTARGICWLPNNGAPTTANPKTVDGDRSGNFSSAITGLVNGTTYYIRAYATNVYGTSYGPYVPVTTKVIPTVTTNVPSISGDKPGIVFSGGNITNDGGASITEKGVCWSSTNATPTLADTHSSDGTGAGNFSSVLSGLDATKTYYVRAYAKNSAGIAYGNVITPGLPSVITGKVTLSESDVSLATGGGTVTSEGGVEVYARGICWSSTTAAPTIANSPFTTDYSRSGIFTSSLSGLKKGTTYYVRAYATNALGTVYGSYVMFVVP